MPRRSFAVLSLLLLGLVGGCNNPLEAGRPAMLGPAEMRINPTFTRLTTNGLRADVELTDAFDDATKGGGAITFELFEYEARDTDVLGDRIGEPARYDLSTIGAQRAHWQSVVRTYRFDLPWPDLRERQAYVLVATYVPQASGPVDGSAETAADPEAGRLFDRLVIQPPAPVESDELAPATTG